MLPRSSRSLVCSARRRLRNVQLLDTQSRLEPCASTPGTSSSTTSSRSLHSSTRFLGPQTAWAEATEQAHSVLTPPSPSLPRSTYDPLSAISDEISSLKSSLFHLLGSSHPSLDTVAKYYFQSEGKHIRPLLVLLMSQATNGLGERGWKVAREQSWLRGVDDSLTGQREVLNDWNPEQETGSQDSMVFASPFRILRREHDHGASSSSGTSTSSSSASSSTASQSQPQASSSRSVHTSAQGLAAASASASTSSPLSSPPPSDPDVPEILPTQRRLASIAEMIHVASLLHDDVIDSSPLRRGVPSAPNAFGNKLSILSGDFILGRASIALARLGSGEVVELLATVIANLTEGEVMQLKATSEPEEKPTKEGFEEYMRKTYLKTASLMAKSARAAVILGGCGTVEGGKDGQWVKDVAYGYGRNLGIAFQLVDDALDFNPSASLGKPSLGADLSLGLATAPALFAWETQPSLGPLIKRRFSEPGDVELARELVGRSDGIQRTLDLARKFADEAKALMGLIPDSEARKALIELADKAVQRVK